MSSINLVTGTPGAGKSLWTIQHVKELAEREDRPVFYHHIDDLALHWHQLDDGTQWMNVPEGSIIVIDEAHKTFPPRASSRQPPLHVEALGELRHQGLTLFVITQSANSVDSFLRDRVTRHYFLQRKQGQERATLYQDETLINVRSKRDLKELTGQVWNYPKEAYNYYKSAEVHTVKRRLPPGMWRLGLLVPFILIALYMVVNMNFWGYATGDGSDIAVTNMPSTDNGILGSLQSSEEEMSPFDPQYLKPIVEGRPWTAPVYKVAQQVKDWPRPNCIRNEITKSCRCYSQQATILATTTAICNALIEQGFFDPTKEPTPVIERAQDSQPLLMQNATDIDNRMELSRIVPLHKHNGGTPL